jgi:hypothetical protein
MCNPPCFLVDAGPPERQTDAVNLHSIRRYDYTILKNNHGYLNFMRWEREFNSHHAPIHGKIVESQMI